MTVRFKKTLYAMALAVLAGAPLFLDLTPVLAGEGGGSNMVLGATTYQTPVIPDAGFYYTNYLNYYHASRLNDNNGNNFVPGLNLNVWSDYNQFTYVTPFEAGDLKFAVGAIVPVASAYQAAGGASTRVTGLGDINVQPLIVGWSRGNFHIVMVHGIIMPTGKYDASSDVNVGRNTWQYEPQISVGYVDPTGIEATATISYLTSTRNNNPMQFFANPTGSDYQSGDELAVDFALGYNITPAFELGLTGYYYQQLTADTLRDAAANADLQQNFDGFKGRVAALGIGARYLTQYGEFYGHVVQEFAARNRSEGTSAWLRWSVSF